MWVFMWGRALQRKSWQAIGWTISLYHGSLKETWKEEEICSVCSASSFVPELYSQTRVSFEIMVTFLWYAVEESTRSILLTLQLQDLEGKPWMSCFKTHFFFMASRGRLLLLCSVGSANLFQMSLSFQSCVSSLFFSWTWSLFSKLWGWGRYAYQSCQSQDVGQWVWKAQSLWMAAVLIQHFIHFKMIFNLSKNFPGCKGGTVNSLVALTDCVCWQRPGQLCLGGELTSFISVAWKVCFTWELYLFLPFEPVLAKCWLFFCPSNRKKILFTFPQRWEVQILHYFSRISRYLYFTWLC